MSTALVDLARCRAREACAAPANRFGAAFLDEHVAVVAERAAALAPALGADPQVLAAAAWLHDLAAVQRFDRLATHAADGAVLARDLLLEAGADPAFAGRVADAVAAHGAPLAEREGAPEVVALAAADLLAQLARPVYWWWYLFAVRELTPAEAVAWWRPKLGPLFDRLPAAARALGASDRDRVAAIVG